MGTINIAFGLYLFSFLLLAKCGWSERTALHGGYYNTKQSPTKNDTTHLGVAESRTSSEESRNSCRGERRKALRISWYKKPFIPLCSSDGSYAPLQCDIHTASCWCVDEMGKEVKGSRTKRTPNCMSKIARELRKKPCHVHRKYMRHLPFSDKIHLPVCKANGFFKPMQCSGNKKLCWCVKDDGTEVEGSVTFGKPLCTVRTQGITDTFAAKRLNYKFAAKRLNNKPPCLAHKKKTKNVGYNVWTPTCDEEGFYAAKQCHENHCWCSDRQGLYITGSRKRGNVECESSALSGPSRKSCHKKRRKALRISWYKKPFIPLCSSDGSYAPLQCDIHTALCWCVDEMGKEIKGSRTKRTPNCMSKIASKSRIRPCHLQKKYMRHLPSSDKIYLPVCKANGFFKPIQCSRNKKFCWCVKDDGTEVKGSVTFGKPLCGVRTQGLPDVFNARHTNRTPPCLRHNKKIENAISLFRHKVWKPTCDEEGFYAAKQCHNNHCWCSDRQGLYIAGSRKKGNVECGETPSGPAMGPCLVERRKALKKSLFKVSSIPQCGGDGYYTPLQCDSSKGICWCVDKEGKKIAGSRTKRTPNCFSSAFNAIGEGPCSLLKAHIERMQSARMIHKPVCEGNGFFQPTQCSKDNEYCWCVTEDGTEVEGSVTFGKPRCRNREKPAPAVPRVRGPCEDHIFHLNNLDSEREVYTPVCDKKGFFAPRQCDNHSGFCWCVDRYGSTIQGTRIKGTPICGEEASTPCHAFKKKSHQIKPGSNQPYQPVCTKEGSFAPLQCNIDSGSCWCVNKTGEAISGTRIYQRPYCGVEKRLCEYKRRSLLSNLRGPEEYVLPSCDLHGYYSPIQCNHSSDECWCSDRYGNEISGSRIKGIPECGQIPRPCDEHASRSSNYDYVFGVYIPQCDSQGYYKTVQCHKKTNICWCSSRIGVEIPGTKTDGEPSCFINRIS